MIKAIKLLAFAALCCGAWASTVPQNPFSANQASSAPSNRFKSLSEDQFSVLHHPLFKEHRVRVKKTRFCDGDVQCVAISPSFPAHPSVFKGAILATSMSAQSTFSSTSLKAGATHRRTTLFCGPMEALEHLHRWGFSWKMVRRLPLCI